MAQRLECVAHSLRTKRQRRLLDTIGAEVGTPVVYLKAAWADPVLYDARGARQGGDIDILVSAKAYENFAEQLLRHGFHRQPSLTLHTAKGECFRGHGGQLDVDLHRSLAQPPWFRLDDASIFARARAYESPDGPILGLCPNDQVLHLITHYANARFTLDDRHLGDIIRIIDRFPIDWFAIFEDCQRAFLEVAFQLVVRLLRRHRAAVPEIAESTESKLRRLAIGPLFDDQGRRRFFTNSRRINEYVDLFAFLPLVSTRKIAFARLAAAVAADRLRSVLSGA